MSAAGLDLSVNWENFFLLGMVVLIIGNMHFGISTATMLLPFREWIPGFYGLDSLIGISLIILFFQKYWASLGWAVTFAFVFLFTWAIS
ncbi:hypothetical protein HY989_06115 [Candidatus Micrarchaeota archaeon]|nr:hypothetical protein [Candidatus Micrarchaeota archaeon]